MLSTRHTDVVGDSSGRSYVTELGHSEPVLRTRALNITKNTNIILDLSAGRVRGEFHCLREEKKCQETLGLQGLRISFGRHNHHHIRLVGMNECVPSVYRLSCLCCLGGGPRVDLITYPWRPYMFLCGQKKYVCDPKFNSLSRQIVAL